jgi:hypothetical protein
MPFTLNFTGTRITDLIRQVLSASGTSAADLATYDALPVGGTMVLTSPTTQAFQQTVRANALSMLPGAYRINGADTYMDSPGGGLTSNGIAAYQGAGSSSAETRIQAGTLPVFAFLYTGGGGGAGQFKMRRTDAAFVPGSLITAGSVFNTLVFPDTNYPGVSGRYFVFVQKRPSVNVPTIDNNADGAFSGSIAMLGGPANWVAGGYNTTTYATGNLNHRQWQAIAAPISNW